MFSVEDNGETVGYVMGTVHNVRLHNHPGYDRKMEEALAKSSILFVEDIGDISWDETIKEFKIKHKDRPKKYYSESINQFTPEEKGQITEVLSTFQVDSYDLELWELLVYVFYDYSRAAKFQLGMDKTLISRFKSTNKEVVGLENALTRLEDFEVLTRSQEELIETIRDLLSDEKSSSSDEEECNLINNYGNPKGAEVGFFLEEKLNSASLLGHQTTSKRNKRYIENLIPYLMNQQHPFFIAVGNAHLFLDDSVLQLLKKHNPNYKIKYSSILDGEIEFSPRTQAKIQQDFLDLPEERQHAVDFFSSSLDGDEEQREDALDGLRRWVYQRPTLSFDDLLRDSPKTREIFVKKAEKQPEDSLVELFRQYLLEKNANLKSYSRAVNMNDNLKDFRAYCVLPISKQDHLNQIMKFFGSLEINRIGRQTIPADSGYIDPLFQDFGSYVLSKLGLKDVLLDFVNRYKRSEIKFQPSFSGLYSLNFSLDLLLDHAQVLKSYNDISEELECLSTFFKRVEREDLFAMYQLAEWLDSGRWFDDEMKSYRQEIRYKSGVIDMSKNAYIEIPKNLPETIICEQKILGASLVFWLFFPQDKPAAYQLYQRILDIYDANGRKNIG